MNTVLYLIYYALHKTNSFATYILLSFEVRNSTAYKPVILKYLSLSLLTSREVSTSRDQHVPTLRGQSNGCICHKTTELSGHIARLIIIVVDFLCAHHFLSYPSSVASFVYVCMHSFTGALEDDIGFVCACAEM